MRARPGGDVTGQLVRWTEADQSVLDELAPLLYAELRRLARRHMAHERKEHSFSPPRSSTMPTCSWWKPKYWPC